METCESTCIATCSATCSATFKLAFDACIDDCKGIRPRSALIPAFDPTTENQKKPDYEENGQNPPNPYYKSKSDLVV